MTLDAEVRVTAGDLAVDARLRVGDGEVVALLGPNGAGKTTVLRALAGLRPLEGGRIRLDGRVLDDPAADVWVAPEARGVGYVPQDHLLFPHLSALENVAFGLRCRGVGRDEARRRAAAGLERLGVGHRAGARPRTLSGGEAQRVALARALAVAPRLLLLDEPLAALDAATRVEVRSDLRRHLADVAGARLLVTHDPVDAMVLADRLVVIEAGRVVQDGTAAGLSRHPRSAYVARLVGVNLLRGAVEGPALRLQGGALLHLAAPPAADGRPALATIRPSAVSVHRHPPEGSPRNVWPATAVDVDLLGDRVRVALEGPVPVVAEVTTAAFEELGLRPGAAVWASVKATDVDAYPA